MDDATVAAVDDLISRLRERAHDPRRRTDGPTSISLSGAGGTLTSTFGSLGSIVGPQAGGGGLSSLAGDLRRLVQATQSGSPVPADIRQRSEAFASSFGDYQPPALPAVAPPAAIAALERRLGRQLPMDLKRLYTEIADGGFGPGGGLLPLASVEAAYEELTAEAPGPRGEPWPPDLLPIQDLEPGYECLDLATGRIVAWDPEELDEADRQSWSRSMKPTADSLAAWLEAWLDRPDPAQALQARVQASMVEEARKSRARIAAKTPEERRAMGLPDVGWERVIWGGIGLEDDES